MAKLTGKVTRNDGGWYHWLGLPGVTFSAGPLCRWQRRWFDVDTDWYSFAGFQVAGWHVGAAWRRRGR